MLGLGSDNVEFIPADEQGRDAPDEMPKLDEASLVVAQVGSQLRAIDRLAPSASVRAVGSWVHVDGAFVDFARVLPSIARFVTALKKPIHGR